jgi:hypothetical protein
MISVARQRQAMLSPFAFVRGSWGHNTPRGRIDTRPSSNLYEVSSLFGKRASSTSTTPTMPKYPGLGLPLRHNKKPATGSYPIGSYGAESDILPVREVAMMSVMDLLTDKENWHKKVFDEKIVAKWRDEALAIPDLDLWNIATNGSGDTIEPLKGVITSNTFDCVSSFGDASAFG